MNGLENGMGIYSFQGSINDPVIIFSKRDGNKICSGKRCFTSTNLVARGLSLTISKIYEFFRQNFHLEGIDGKGNLANMSIDWNIENAQWGCRVSQGSRDCSWAFSNTYALKPEVVGHEYFHAIAHHLAPLNLRGESGALNESLADVFGIAFKDWWNCRQNSDWDIGGLRNIGVPCDMSLYKQGITFDEQDDFGYIHHNSCIPSHAFAKAVMRTNTTSYGRVSQIWFQAFLKVNRDENFKTFAYKTIACSIQFSKNDTSKIVQAWIDVKVLKIEVAQLVTPNKKSEKREIIPKRTFY